MVITNAKSSQNHSITTTEMCNATVTKVSFDRVQFIRTAHIPFGLCTYYTLHWSSQWWCV